MKREDIRNIAIIAHVDHGKTTLVDQMLRQSGTFRANQQVAERVMDSNDIERERGITILAKNTAIVWKDTTINVVDTPGHADFGGEVERILNMVDGVLLLVDAYEGPMPQTRFVLQKALELNLKVIVVINKVDRPDARCEEVVDEVLDLFIELQAEDHQLESPFLYASGRKGIASLEPEITDDDEDLSPLLDAILTYVPCPEGDGEGPTQLLVSSIDYNDYVGRIGVGRVDRGEIHVGQEVVVANAATGAVSGRTRISSLYEFMGLNRVNTESAKMGDIVALSGIEGLTIGDTVCDAATPEPLPFVEISQPTIQVTFSVNNSPLAGREGQYVTSRHLRARLYRELNTDVGLRVEDTDSPDAFLVAGRGELHLTVLMENMRRQGFEFQVSKPLVLFKEIDGVKCEPIEFVVCDVPENMMGPVMEKLGSRKGELVNMVNQKGGRVRLEFRIPSRGIFGYRNEFLTDTHGEGIMSSVFDSYAPYKGDIPRRNLGSLIAFESGTAMLYGLYHSQDRGELFVEPSDHVYGGQVVGISSRGQDIAVNVCKTKAATNVRSAGADEAMRLAPVVPMTLERALEFIDDDELVEVTPKSIRIRKRILDATERYRAERRGQ
ncbi:MAG: translational GTPase TypA [Christensenellales bacterium]